MERIKKINAGLDKLYPDGRDPFRIITRLTEECGELAAQVTYWEGDGIKNEKHGLPDRVKLAKEAQDVLRCVLQIVTYYEVEAELVASIEASYRNMQQSGLID